MRAIEICSVLLAVLLVKTTTSSQKDNVAAIINASNRFTTTMYDALLKDTFSPVFDVYDAPLEDTFSPVFLSPIGLYTALSMLHQGAECKTFKALSRTLNLPDKASSADGFQKITKGLKDMDGVTLKIINKLYVNTGYSIKPAFKDVAVHKFNAAIENVDFAQNVATAKAINAWVEKKTHHKIKDLISSEDLDHHTRSVLVNAVYFKADWLVKFDKLLTWKERFYSIQTDGQGDIDVDTMHIANKIDYKFDVELNASVIRLPYANTKLNMVFILPREDYGISEVEKILPYYNLSALTEGMENVDMLLSMPRFKIEMKVNLTEPLKKSGLSNIFSKKANFLGLLDSSEPLYVSKVVQKLFFEVNEEGRTAAPSITDTPDREPKPFPLRFEHSFICMLQKERNILFYGRVTNPNN